MDKWKNIPNEDAKDLKDVKFQVAWGFDLLHISSKEKNDDLGVKT